MTQAQYGLMISLAILAGFLGGMSAEYLRGTFAIAQDAHHLSKSVVAERFEVVDKDGHVRIAIGPDLILFETETESGTERTMLGSAGMLMAKIEPEALLETSLGPSGLVITGNGRNRMEFSLRSGEPFVRLRDGNGRTRAAVGAISTDPEHIRLDYQQAAFSLALFNQDGKIIWSAP